MNPSALWRKAYKLVGDNKADPVKQDIDLGQVARRLDILDRRLDSIDSTVTSLIEKVMGRPLILEVTCPHCGAVIQVNVTGAVKLRGKE